MSSIWDFINSINDKSKYMGDDEDLPEVFDGFITNRSLSLFPDTILYANQNNSQFDLDKKLQYDFYFYGIRNRKRRAKWPKKENDNDVKLIMQNYQYSESKALSALSILSEKQLDELRTRLNNFGGVK